MDPISRSKHSDAKAIAVFVACAYLAQHAASALDSGLGFRVYGFRGLGFN